MKLEYKPSCVGRIETKAGNVCSVLQLYSVDIEVYDLRNDCRAKDNDGGIM